MINSKILETYIDNGFNILMQGKHGVGKTAVLTEACNNLGLGMKYYSASSLDPYTDLVGIPEFIDTEDGGRAIRSVRPQEINEAEVVFFDELNRADSKVLDAVFELIQFGSINGEKLPKLKCVVAAQNPPDGEYNVEPLDPALADRFQIHLDIKPEVSKSYLTGVLKEETAEALVKWHKDHGTKADYISPRRIEMIGRVWEATEDRFSLVAAMPSGGTFDVGKLFNLLNKTALPEDQEALLDGIDLGTHIRRIGADQVVAVLSDVSPTHREIALDNLADALAFGFGPKSISDYLDVIDLMSEQQIDRMTSSWEAAKKKMIGADAVVKKYGGVGGFTYFRNVLAG